MKSAIAALLLLAAVSCGTPPEAEDAAVEDGAAARLALEEEDFDFEAALERGRRLAAEELSATTGRRELEELEREAPPRVPRRIRRWPWESPGETRARLWAIPAEETATATATALLRVCTSEADFDGDRDCVGIWEVVQNVRSRGCRREVLPRITECDADGETALSALRRLQRVVLGMVPPRSRRSRWIAELELDCNRPPSFPEGETRWDARERPRCERLAELVRELASGESDRRVTRGAWAIAWGGRCEDAGGACDDPLACARGLARIPGTQTRNAFWCRPGSRGCAEDLDPVCYQLRIFPAGFGEGIPDRAILGRGGERPGRPGRGSRGPDVVAVADGSLEVLADESAEPRPVVD